MGNSVFNKKVDLRNWVVFASIRAIKTMAQTAVGIIGASFMMEEVSWGIVLSGALLSGILSLLTSVAGIPEVPAEE